MKLEITFRVLNVNIKGVLYITVWHNIHQNIMVHIPMLSMYTFFGDMQIFLNENKKRGIFNGKYYFQVGNQIKWNF